MKAKRYVIALLSALALMPCWTRLSAEPVIFFFSGQITERRAQNSVFTQPNTDQFYGYFSYDTVATTDGFGHYPLISFSIDGNSLNFSSSPSPPGIPGITVRNGNGFPGSVDAIDIQGFYPPAAANPNDGGYIDIRLIDSAGLVFTNNSLPTSLDLSSFDMANLLSSPIVLGPSPPYVPTYDRGTIMQLTQVPEPAGLTPLVLGLAGLFIRARVRRIQRLALTEP